jgi:hypothetical protein
LGVALVTVIMIFGQSAEPVKHEDLVAHYERYNGSRVVVRGEVVSDEGTVMYLPGGPTDSGAPAGMVISFTEELSRKPGALEKRFIKVLKKSGRVDATLSGRFEGTADRRWGHQACCRFRLAVDRVISLK